MILKEKEKNASTETIVQIAKSKNIKFMDATLQAAEYIIQGLDKNISKD